MGEIIALVNLITIKLMGVNINRNTVANMKRAGLHVVEEKSLFRDVVKFVVANP